MIETMRKDIREMLACREALRRLNFEPDEIHFEIGNMTGPNTGSAFVVVTDLKYGTGARFIITGATGIDIEAFSKDIKEACEWWNSDKDDEEKRQLFETSGVRENAANFCMALSVKGMLRSKEFGNDKKAIQPN